MMRSTSGQESNTSNCWEGEIIMDRFGWWPLSTSGYKPSITREEESESQGGYSSEDVQYCLELRWYQAECCCPKCIYKGVMWDLTAWLRRWSSAHHREWEELTHPVQPSGMATCHSDPCQQSLGMRSKNEVDPPFLAQETWLKVYRRSHSHRQQKWGSELFSITAQ